MSFRAKISAFKELAGDVADLRLGITDATGIELAKELGTEASTAVQAAVAVIEAQPPRPTEADGDDALIEWALFSKANRDAFWQHFEGVVVDGVTIIRKR